MENSFSEISMYYSFVKKLQNSIKYLHSNGEWKGGKCLSLISDTQLNLNKNKVLQCKIGCILLIDKHENNKQHKQINLD